MAVLGGELSVVSKRQMEANATVLPSAVLILALGMRTDVTQLPARVINVNSLFFTCLIVGC